MYWLRCCISKLIVDLVSAALGAKIIAFSDEFFASATNLINPLTPVRRPNTFTENGAWYDGWETRRHNDSPEGDWVVIKLGVGSGTVTGFEVDTTFFTGNHAPEVQVLGTFSPETKGVPSTEVRPYFEMV
jgi:allantoicase